MRVTVGIVGVLGLCVTVAVAAAQNPGAAAPKRGATLLAPQAVHAPELPGVARAAPEELSGEPGMTPVVRPSRAAAGPGWLNGTDPNVHPAGGVVRPLTAGGAKAEPSLVSKGVDKLKTAFGTTERPDLVRRTPGSLPPATAPEQPNANSPFRGTATNGAPVFAGPPAYRWYGWGSVTPGANPHAPNGQYPPASANWYSITGATPGAFPVPVMNPLRPAPGTEPPAYVSTPHRRIPPVTNPTPAPAVTVPTSRGTAPPTESVAHAPPPTDLSAVAPPRRDVRPTPTPTISQPPGVAAPAPPPTVAATPVTTEKEPPLAAQPAPSVAPAATGATPAVTPAALPVSVTEEKLDWQPRTGPAGNGEWGPSGARPLPAATPAGPGATRPVQGQTIARGQAEATRTDPTVSLIRSMCDGRATGIDVRWTGSKKLTVNFECRTAAEGQRLVKDISARPELKPLEIEFAVTVK